jgi:autoinducer 2-degrading protein
MFALFVTIQVKPEHREAFIEATMGDANGSNNDEPGCLRFDVLQDNQDPSRMYLYEVYKDRESWEVAHRETPHYLKWRETVQDWFAAETVRTEATPVYAPPGHWRE